MTSTDVIEITNKTIEKCKLEDNQVIREALYYAIVQTSEMTRKETEQTKESLKLCENCRHYKYSCEEGYDCDLGMFDKWKTYHKNCKNWEINTPKKCTKSKSQNRLTEPTKEPTVSKEFVMELFKSPEFLFALNKYIEDNFKVGYGTVINMCTDVNTYKRHQELLEQIKEKSVDFKQWKLPQLFKKED